MFFQAEANPQEKLKMLRALTCIRVPWILSHFLELAKDESVVRSQDYFSFLTFLSWNRVGQPLVWDFVRTEWNYLVGRFTLNDRLFGRFWLLPQRALLPSLGWRRWRTFLKQIPKRERGKTTEKSPLRLSSRQSDSCRPKSRKFFNGSTKKSSDFLARSLFWYPMNIYLKVHTCYTKYI